MKHKKSKKGYTLLELVIVISVISILCGSASILLTNGNMQNTRTAQAKACAEMMTKAIHLEQVESSDQWELLDLVLSDYNIALYSLETNLTNQYFFYNLTSKKVELLTAYTGSITIEAIYCEGYVLKLNTANNGYLIGHDVYQNLYLPKQEVANP